MSDRVVKPYLGLFIGIIAVSFASIFIRLAEAPSLVIAAYRMTIASLILTLPTLLRARGELRNLTARELRLALLSGLFLGLHFASWITSLEYTSVASSVVFVSTHPIFVGLASPLLLKEKLSRWTLMGVVIAVLGGTIIGYGDLGLGQSELFGDLLAVVGAVMAAGYFLIGRALRPRLSLLAYIFLAYSTAAVTVVALALLTGGPFGGYTGRTYLMFFLLAVVPQIIGHSSFNWALRYLSATFVAVTILGEPVGSTILACFILGEIPTIFKLIGGALILAGIYIASREERSLEGTPAPALQMKYILFDLDNTLYPRHSGVMQIVSQRISQYMEQRLGLEPSLVKKLREEYWRRYGTSLRGLQLHHDVDAEDYLAYVHDFPVEEYLKPDSDLDLILGRIEAEKVVFTNASAEYARRVLRALGVEDHFGHIFDIHFLDYACKPDERAYKLVLEALGARGEECVIVDDSPRNLRPAKRLGMTTVLVGDDGAGCMDFAIARVTDLAEVLSKIGR